MAKRVGQLRNTLAGLAWLGFASFGLAQQVDPEQAKLAQERLRKAEERIAQARVRPADLPGATDRMLALGQVSSEYILAGTRVNAAARDSNLLAKLTKSKDAFAVEAAQKRIEADSRADKLSASGLSFEARCVRAEIRTLLPQNLLGPDETPPPGEGNLSKWVRPTKAMSQQLDELAHAAVDWMQAEQDVKGSVTRRLMDAARGEVFEGKRFPSSYRIVSAETGLTRSRILLGLRNDTGKDLHNCVVVTHLKPDQSKFKAFEDKKITLEQMLQSFAAGLGNDPALSGNPWVTSVMGLDLENVDKGAITYIPNWPAGALLEVPVAAVRSLIWSESADVSFWSDEGFLEQQPVQTKALFLCANDAFKLATARERAEQERQRRMEEDQQRRAQAGQYGGTSSSSGSSSSGGTRERPPIRFPVPRRVR